MKAESLLESALTDIAVIRTSFETMDLFPPDDPIRTEISEIMLDARLNMVERLRRMLKLAPRVVGAEFYTGDDGFRDFAIGLATTGYPRRKLDSMLKVNVFCAVARALGDVDCTQTLFRYELNEPCSRDALKSLSGVEVMQLFVTDILRAVENPSLFTDKVVFDREVYQKVAALIFCHYAGSDPFFYGG